MFAVVFFTSQDKENDWSVHNLFTSEEAARAYIQTIRTCDPDVYEYEGPWPRTSQSQRTLLIRYCEENYQVGFEAFLGPLIALVKVPVVEDVDPTLNIKG